ncbi:antimicrobial peptide ABC transporter ATPase [Cyanobium sp. Copco_Reservoir_LC18]|jgi:putative ABC transport system ATP-binding protein|uniref:ABC transporter ATP-binding protein n=1 Tax=Cyanobium sp. Copco_Reservoir_LC18 TaxID=1328305 RepID=UPI0013568934|nr:ABC transporter ATP-binding protein [Cyanobium sp. Copco_Reservoir_LC18]KAF0653180.1 antimicrobial peptide ABC transporter ATPase [Cyanobium sp. Copco_Reservoir_LC18]
MLAAPLAEPLAASPASAIELRGLSKRFQEGESERTVLQAVDLTIAPGQFVVLLGQSGSGKSTLLHLIGGIDTPSSGSVAIGAVELTALDERNRTLFRRDHIGFIFQFFNLIPTLSVLENVTLPGELAGRPRPALEADARDLLGRVGLADRASTRPDRLSGGQQQRVAIARALLHRPLLILADEPTGNLDEHTGEQVLELLIDLTRQQGRTLIMATHNGAIAARADRVLRVQEGHLLEASAPAAAVPA